MTTDSNEPAQAESPGATVSAPQRNAPLALHAPARGAWLVIGGALFFWLTTLGGWVATTAHSSGYGGSIYDQDVNYAGGAYFLLGGLGAFIVFVGLAVWLAIAAGLVPLRVSTPKVPVWAPLLVTVYAAYGLLSAWLDYTRLSQSDFQGGFGGYATTGPTLLWIVAVLAMLIMLWGALRYLRTGTRNRQALPSQTRSKL